MWFPQRESQGFFSSDSVGLGQTWKRKRIRVEKSSETLAGQAFSHLAVKRQEESQEEMTSKQVGNVSRLGVSCACRFLTIRKPYKYKPFGGEGSKHALFSNVFA